MILAQRQLLTLAKSEVTVGRLEIERLKLMLARGRREQFGKSSERGRLLVEQLELAIEDLEETQAEQETKAEIAAPEAAKQKRAQNPRPPRRPLPDNLPVERIVEPAPCACGKCGSERLHKLGEVVSKTLECEPRRWKIIEHVREKFSCRDCEAITAAPAPSHPIPRPLGRERTDKARWGGSGAHRLSLTSAPGAREAAAGQAVVCPLLRGRSPPRGVAPNQHWPRINLNSYPLRARALLARPWSARC